MATTVILALLRSFNALHRTHKINSLDCPIEILQIEHKSQAEPDLTQPKSKEVRAGDFRRAKEICHA